MFISWLHFLCMFILTGIFLRFIQLTYPNTALGKALTVIC